MKNKIIIFIFVLLNIFYFSQANAQETGEVNTSQLLKEIDTIISNNLNDKMDIAITNAIQIIKNNPNSLEAFYTLTLLREINLSAKVTNVFKELKDKYYPSINDLNTDFPEKIILAFLIGCGIESQNFDEQVSNFKQIIDILKNNKDSCQNINNKSLISILLFLDKEHSQQYMDDFLTNFPDHPAVPLVTLDKISLKYIDGSALDCIEEIKLWKEKYGEKISPLGWTLNVEAYSLITSCYISVKDFDSARKYYDLINKEAPLYYGPNSIISKILSNKNDKKH